MVFILVIICILIIVNLLFFVSRTFSPIPFFPTNKKDLPLITKTLLEVNQVERYSGDSSQVNQFKTDQLRTIAGLPIYRSTAIVDLGAGTGTVIFPAAQDAYHRHLSTQFYAIEIHPLLILIMHLKRLLHPNRANIHILCTDLFKFEIRSTKQILNSKLSIYLYVGPFVMERLKPVLKTFPKGTRIVSYMYEIPGWKNRLQEVQTGVKKLFIYKV